MPRILRISYPWVLRKPFLASAQGFKILAKAPVMASVIDPVPCVGSAEHLELLSNGHLRVPLRSARCAVPVFRERQVLFSRRRASNHD